MSALSIFLSIVLVLASLLIVLVVLLQRPKQEGLGASFGGGMLDSSFGAHTTDVLQKATVWFAVIFFGGAMLLTVVKARQYAGIEPEAKKVLEGIATPEAPAIPPVVPQDSPTSLLPPTNPDGTTPKPADAPKADAPKADAPKADAPKADAPKADAPKADAPKADAPKADAPPAPAKAPEAPKAAAPAPASTPAPTPTPASEPKP